MMTRTYTTIIDVAAGVLVNDDQVLLARRPFDDRPYPGYWEFPGGKVEPGESPLEAVKRELQEEIDIEVTLAHPWITRLGIYPNMTVKLHFFFIREWEGIPACLEHAALQWFQVDQIDETTLLPANRPLIKLLQLPSFYGITQASEIGPHAMLKGIEQAIVEKSLRWIQFREKTLPIDQRLLLAQQIMELAARHGVKVSYNVASLDDWDIAQALKTHGVHLTTKMGYLLQKRPNFQWVGMSCHTEKDFHQAAFLDCDYTSLSPVLPTASHPTKAGMGWDEFQRLSQGVSLPVFALGGLCLADLPIAQAHGAHGIACMRALW